MTKKILVELIKLLEDDTLICGGHFLLEGGLPKTLNEGTIDSFEIAVKLFQNAKSKNFRNIGLGILLNDIGQVCGNNDSCTILNSKPFDKTDFKLPDEYLEILKENKVNIEDLVIYWEKTMRNRGKKLFNKQKNDGIFLLKDGDYYFDDSGGMGEILVLREMKSDKYGTCACPMIMAAFSKSQEKAGFNTSINIYYIGRDNTINIPNHTVIEKGKRLGEVLGVKLNVKNLYFSEDSVLKNF